MVEDITGAVLLSPSRNMILLLHGNRFNGTRASTGLTEEAVIRGFTQKVKQFVCMNTDLDGVCGLGGCSPVTVMEVKELSSVT